MKNEQKGEIRIKVRLSAFIYSFAIVMWEILTQQRPYPGRNHCIHNTSHLYKVSGKRSNNIYAIVTFEK